MSESGTALDDLLAIMDTLRDPEHGCPWDLEQDFVSIAPHTLEEVYEVVDAIEEGSREQLQAELGDLLFQIVFYARLGKEEGEFDFTSIVSGICQKLLQRHPHVFPDGTLTSAGTKPALNAVQVVHNWEQLKATERKQRSAGNPVSVMDDVPHALTALLRAGKLQKRAAIQGFDWPDTMGVLAKVKEEFQELEVACAEQDQEHIAEEFGDLMFSMVNLGRHLQLNSETALRMANRKFEARFRAMEVRINKSGKSMQALSQEEMEQFWELIKAAQIGRAHV